MSEIIEEREIPNEEQTGPSEPVSPTPEVVEETQTISSSAPEPATSAPSTSDESSSSPAGEEEEEAVQSEDDPQPLQVRTSHIELPPFACLGN